MKVKNFYNGYKYLINKLDSDGVIKKVERKNLETHVKETNFVTYTITNPIDCEINLNSIKSMDIWTKAECLTEFLNLNPPMMKDYNNSFIKNFELEDGMHNYTYGERWHTFNQLTNLYKRLKKEPNTRQAVMTLYRGDDTNENAWNIPCTIIHQFQKNKDKLDMTVYYRSNDILKGVKNDVYVSSFILQAFSGWLDLEVGNINFVINNLHVYENDWEQFDKIKTEINNNQSPKKKFEKNKDYFSLDIKTFYDEINLVKSVEECSKYMNFKYALVHDELIQTKYFHNWSMTFMDYWLKKAKEKTNK